MRERPLARVPAPVALAFAGALGAQLAWHALEPRPSPSAEALPAPPPLAALRVAALGEEAVLSRLVMVWLQAFDNQPGVSIPFARLDYARVAAWLDRALGLDPRSDYPLLAASRLYAAVGDEGRQRLMLDWVHARFLEDPNRRWRWLAHAVIVAKHQLGDLELALHLARSLTDRATGTGVPAWARDMTVSVLEDLGELDAARVLIGGLLESGRVRDPNEIRFLVERLEQLEEAARAPGP